MKKIKILFCDSAKFQIGLMAIILMVLFSYSITTHLAKSPSEHFSREKIIKTVDSGYIKQVHGHVSSYPINDEEAVIISVNGIVTDVMIINAKGDVLNEFTLELDLYEAREMDSYLSGADEITLYYSIYDLYKVVIDLSKGSFKSEMITEDVRAFEINKDQMVVEKEEGLYLYTDNIIKIVDEELNDYSLNFYNDELYIVGAFANEYKSDIRLLAFNMDGSKILDTMIKEKTGDSYLNNIKDLQITDSLEWDRNDLEINSHTIATVLFQWTDKRFGIDYVTIWHLNPETGAVYEELRESFSIHKSYFEFIDINNGEVTMVLMEVFESSINLLKTTMSGIKETRGEWLTKTKGLSMYSGYYMLGNTECIVFVDIVDGNKIISFASSDLELIEETTNLLSVNPLRVLVVIIAVVFVGAFLGVTVYGLFVAVPPAFIVILGHKFLKFKNSDLVLNTIGAVIHTFSKIVFLRYIMNDMDNFFAFRPPVIGEEPNIYIYMTVMSLISYVIMFRYFKRNKEYNTTWLTSYLLFIFAEFVQFTLSVYVYNSALMILDKI